MSPRAAAPERDAGPAVSVRQLTCAFGTGPAAVDGISFEVVRGEMFGLIGPDGAGKSTTLRCVLGLLSPTAGSLRTCGLDPRRQRRALSGRAGYLSQRFGLYGDLTVDENIAFFARVRGVSGWRARHEQLIERLGLAPFRSRLAERLSGGMKQKLALSCTLIHAPELLVLDEPTTGVDPVSRREFWKILAELQQGDLTILLTTPYMDEAERCRRVALMDHGRLLGVDDPRALREAWRGSMIEVLARPKPTAVAALRGMAEVGGVEVFGERLHAALPATVPAEAPRAAERIARALRASDCEVVLARAVQPSLEDVFIARLRQSAPPTAGAGPGSEVMS